MGEAATGGVDVTPDTLFWSKVERTDGCWLWTGGTNNGYGRRGNRYAHRVVYEALVGPIPADMEIDHLCRVRRCVNPAHLEAVPHAENVRRGAATVGLLLCKRGHFMVPPNLYFSAKGHRACRACAMERAALRRQRLREAS